MKNSQSKIQQASGSEVRSEKNLSNNEIGEAQPYSTKSDIHSLHRVNVQLDWIRYKMAIS